MSAPVTGLPAVRLGADGQRRVDARAVLRLAAPLMLTNAIQAALNLTDTWFIGRISTDAVAAMGAIYWLMSCAILMLGGVGFAVQSFVSQADGGGRRARAAQAAWNGIWAGLACWPLFVVVASLGTALLRPFSLEPGIGALALSYWEPRMLGAVLGTIGWALMSFFNGIGATRLTSAVAVVTLLANIPANQYFMFELGYGMAGAAHGTNVAQALGIVAGLVFFLGSRLATRYQTRLLWRPRLAIMRRQLAVGLPVGVMYAADVLGVAVMQMMVTQVGKVGAAATQVVMMLTSLAYMPTLGLASAGTTVVGQAIGAGDRDWAARLGTFVTRCCAGLMLGIALSLLLLSPWLLPGFLAGGDVAAGEAVALALLLLWPAAAYQFFDGLYFGSSFALRATGDTAVPARTALLLSWFFFVPLAHTLVFTPEQAWLPGLPQAGLGALGGWLALMAYVMLLGTLMYRRWRSERWRRIDLWGA
jgi:MATE family multidrug resistance protein